MFLKLLFSLKNIGVFSESVSKNINHISRTVILKHIFQSLVVLSFEYKKDQKDIIIYVE